MPHPPRFRILASQRPYVAFLPSGIRHAKILLCILAQTEPQLVASPILPTVVSLLLLYMPPRQVHAACHRLLHTTAPRGKKSTSKAGLPIFLPRRPEEPALQAGAFVQLASHRCCKWPWVAGVPRGPTKLWRLLGAN